MVKDVAVTDAAGERNYKLVGATVSVSQNGNSVNAPVLDRQTLYASPLITITDKGIPSTTSKRVTVSVAVSVAVDFQIFSNTLVR